MSSYFEFIYKYLRRAVFTVMGFITYRFFPRKKIVIVLSSMRSGSTLLKTLLGQADDISLIDEFHFVPYANANKYFFYYLVYRLSDKPIIVLKKPYNNIKEQLEDYGKVPLDDVSVIVLYRRPYETLLSLKAIQKRKGYPIYSDDRCVNYWCDCYEAVLKNIKKYKNVYWVRYEDLTKSPKAETEKLFEFIGSRFSEGVEGYGDYSWKSGRDDDSDKIKSKTVVPAKQASPSDDKGLFAAIEKSPRVSELQRLLMAK